MSEQQQADATKQIANVSKLLRDAIHAALPVAPEQYLTIAIPGTTIDVRDIKDSGTFAWDAEPGPFTPMQVKQAEAKLVDNMIPLAFCENSMATPRTSKSTSARSRTAVRSPLIGARSA